MPTRTPTPQLMTIDKGQEWAKSLSDGVHPHPVADDHEFAEKALTALQANHGRDATLVATPATGALLRTVGLETPRRQDPMAFDVDLVLVTLDDGPPKPMMAHLVVAPTVTGRVLAVMNTPCWRQYRLAPRAHPNDGLVDVVIGQIKPSQWWEGLRRAKTGTHLPHPGLRSKRTSSWAHRFDRRRRVWIDGRSAGLTRTLKIEVIADAATMVA